MALFVAATALMNGCGAGSTDDTDQNVTKHQQPHPGLPPGKMFDNLSPDLFEARINEHRLLVPMNRLKGRPLTQNLVILFARWPGMQSYREGMGPAPYDDLEILLDGTTFGRSSGQPPDGHGRAMRNKGLLPPVMNKKLGLWEYRLAKPSPRPWYYVADVTRKGPDGKARPESVLIICAGLPNVKGNYDTLQCTVFYFVRTDVHVTYRFFHKHIADWHAIDRQVRKLVESVFADHTNGASTWN